LGSSPLGSAHHASIAVDRIRIAEVSYWRTPISPGTILDLRQIRHVTHPQLIRNSVRLIGSSYVCRAEAEVKFVLLSGRTEPTGLRNFSVYENRALRSSSVSFGPPHGLVTINALVSSERSLFTDWPETGLGDINGDLPEADLWQPSSVFPDSGMPVIEEQSPLES
jgi:hypothetical protein